MPLPGDGAGGGGESSLCCVTQSISTMTPSSNTNSYFSISFFISFLILLLLLLRLRLLNTTIQYHGQLINNCIVLWKIDVAGRCEYMPHVLILNSFPLNVRPVVVDALLLHVVIKSNWMSTQTNTNQLHLSFVTYFFGAFRSLVILIIRQARQCLREMEKKTEGYHFFSFRSCSSLIDSGKTRNRVVACFDRTWTSSGDPLDFPVGVLCVCVCNQRWICSGLMNNYSFTLFLWHDCNEKCSRKWSTYVQ